MKQFILILLMAFLFLSCISQKKEISSLCNKLEGTNTNIRDLINIDGYYYTGHNPRHNIMFFDDGSYVMNFFFKEGATDSLIRNNMSEWLKSWVRKDQVNWSAYWGAYRIEGDIIYAQTITPGNFWMGWGFCEDRYYVIDRSSIKMFYFSIPTENDGKILNDTFVFVPCDSLPTSDNPLKEYKWIWRNESDWKAYMERIEENTQ